MTRRRVKFCRSKTVHRLQEYHTLWHGWHGKTVCDVSTGSYYKDKPTGQATSCRKCSKRVAEARKARRKAR